MTIGECKARFQELEIAVGSQRTLFYEYVREKIRLSWYTDLEDDLQYAHKISDEGEIVSIIQYQIDLLNCEKIIDIIHLMRDASWNIGDMLERLLIAFGEESYPGDHPTKCWIYRSLNEGWCN